MSTRSKALSMRKQIKGKIHEIFLRVDRTGDKDLRVFSKDVSQNDEITQVCVIDHEEDKFSGSQGRRKFQGRDDHRAHEGKGWELATGYPKLGP